MNPKKPAFLALILLAVWCLWPISLKGAENAQQATDAESSRETREAPRPPGDGEKLDTTHQTFRLASGDLLNYTATAGWLRLVNESGKPTADIFFVAYTAEGQTGERPLTFAFNGGPGASSMWLHMGVAGPVRALTDEKAAGGGTGQVVPNGYSWLPWTDLVFIDAIGTGFSRAVPAENDKQYFNTQDDIRSIGDFIRLYTAKFGRWRSPKYLAGESYGGMRAAGLLKYLYDSAGMEIAGLLLISPAMDLSVIHQDPSNDLSYVLFVPSFAAAAWYHGKTCSEPRPGLDEVLREAEKWTIDRYMPALARGTGLSRQDRDAIAERLASFTGLPETLIKNRDLRISRHEFTNELLRNEGLALGFLDGRSTTPTRGGSFFEEPSMAMTIPPYTAAVNEYLRNTLHLNPEMPYIFFSHDANSAWNWGSIFSGTDAAESIRHALNRNGRLKVFAAAGYFDLDVPYFATAYAMSHLGVAPGLAANVRVRFFNGGHMFYTNTETLDDFSREVADFFAEITSR